MSKIDYESSTMFQLAHCFGSCLIPFKYALDYPNDRDLFREAKECKEDFLAGLNNAVDKQLPIYGGITHDVIVEIGRLAESIDWLNNEEFQQLISHCRELMNE